MPAESHPARRSPWSSAGLLLGLVCLVFSLAACGSGPNRLETLKYKRQVLEVRQDKDRFFKTSPESPLLTEQQMNFTSLSYFPVDIAYRVTASYQSLSTPREFRIKTSTGHERVYVTLGRLEFTLAGKPYTLFAYQEKSPEGQAHQSLFVPFADRTSGRESYGGGRYLDIPMPSGNSVVLDFNMAYNPYCAYNYNFSCPLPPAENHLDVELRAGEKLFPMAQLPQQ